LSFEGLFLIKVLAATVDQSHHLLVKFSCKNACEKCKNCNMLFAANVAVGQEVIVIAIVIALFILTLLMNTSTSQIEAE